MRICILRTDEVLADFQPQFGDYPQMFMRIFREVAPDCEFACVDVREGVPSEITCDAYLITGSRHSVYEPLPWIPPLVQFLREVLVSGRKILGICFGHQLMAHYFGGEVAQAAQGWAVGGQANTISRHLQCMDDGADTVRLLSSHKDQVQKLPPDGEVYLTSDICPIAGFTVGEQIITVQGHPEFVKPYSEALMTFRREILGETVFQSGIDSLSENTDEHRVVRWLVNFAASGETPG